MCVDSKLNSFARTKKPGANHSHGKLAHVSLNLFFFVGRTMYDRPAVMELIIVDPQVDLSIML